MVVRAAWHEFHDAGLSRRVSYLLMRRGFTTVEEIASIRDELLEDRRDVGPATMAEIRRVIPYQPKQLCLVACPCCGGSGLRPTVAGDGASMWEANG